VNEVCAILPEPEIQFRYDQATADPRDGLGLFGPYSTDFPIHPKNISYAVLGTKSGIDAFKNWSRAITSPILTAADLDSRLWPHFPGFEAAFSCTWHHEPSWSHEIDSQKLLLLLTDLDANKRAFDAVNLFLNGMLIAQKRDESPKVFVCVVPDELWRNCRPESKIHDGTGHRLSSREFADRFYGQGLLFEEYDPQQYRLSVDFRRQLKARAMEFRTPIQIIRESTLSLAPPATGARRLTPLSDRAWNLCSTLYYKAGGKPWRLAGAREGVCYIGIVFRRANFAEGNRMACCAAQMFLDSGDGLVFLGEFGPWYSPRKGDFHLSLKAAQDLLRGILTTYRELGGKNLSEIFLHSRSAIGEEEFQGYLAACPPGVKLIGVRVRLDRDGIRLFRPGSRPVLRGTFLKTDRRNGLLWASGFKPRLGTYDGWEIPAPLQISIQHGAAEIEQVASDIFALTKLNYNACHLGDSEPVTILFSNAVGEVLISNPTIRTRLPNFKFYI
jgi:hypothetical protein